MTYTHAEKKGLLASLVRALIIKGDTDSLGTAILLCPPSLLKKATAIADMPHAISRIQVTESVNCFHVRSGERNHTEYIVVPGRYCSCQFFTDSVVNNTHSPYWTCKHDLAVQLKLGVRIEGIQSSTNGMQLVYRQLTS